MRGGTPSVQICRHCIGSAVVAVLAHLEAGIEAVNARLCEPFVERLELRLGALDGLTEFLELFRQEFDRLEKFIAGVSSVDA